MYCVTPAALVRWFITDLEGHLPWKEWQRREQKGKERLRRVEAAPEVDSRVVLSKIN